MQTRLVVRLWAANRRTCFVLTLNHTTFYTPRTVSSNFRCIYESEDVVVIVKPVNLICDGPLWRWGSFLYLNILTTRPAIEDLRGPGLVHRLDKQTTGVMMYAKTNACHLKQQQQLKLSFTSKHYVAAVFGKAYKFCVVVTTTNIVRLKSSFSVLRSLVLHNNTQLVWLSPKTGRTHQLRQHCRQIGCAIVGGTTAKNLTSLVLQLHATALVFVQQWLQQKRFVYVSHVPTTTDSISYGCAKEKKVKIKSWQPQIKTTSRAAIS